MARKPRSLRAIRHQRRVIAASKKAANGARARFLGAFRRVAGDPSAATLTRSIGEGANVAARVLLPEGGTRAAAAATMEHGTTAGAKAEATFLVGDSAEYGKRLLIKNPILPRAAAWGKKRSAELVTEIEKPARAALRAVISTRLREGVHPSSIAKQIRPWVGIHSRNVPPILRYEAALRKAGAGAAKVEKAVARKIAAAVRERCDLIARTETWRAVNKGREALYQELAAEGHVDPARMVRTWVATPDERLCDICEALDGTTAEGFDDDFGGGIHDPSDAHMDCRCTVLFEERG